MTRLPKEHEEVRKGAWDAEEDEKLRAYVETYGTGHWRSVGKKAGLQRCGKSCRLRWTNYLRPDIRHGSFTVEEEDLIVKLHAALGSRWSLIAAQMPGRTDNDIKNHWNTRLKKKLCDMGIDPVTHKPIAELLRDLAGTMAQSSGSGSQVAEEAARRCFRDSLVNKAVRNIRKHNPAIMFTNQTEETVTTQDMRFRDLDIAQNVISPSNSGYNSHSMDNTSSSENDIDLFRRSASPTTSPHISASSMEHMIIGEHNNSLTSTGEAHFSSFQDSAGSSDQSDTVAGPSTRSVLLQPSTRPDFMTRWLSSRNAFPQEEQQLVPPVSRFGSELQKKSSSTQSHDHHIQMSNHIQGAELADKLTSDSKEDIRNSLGFNHQQPAAGPLQHESFGNYRSFSGPLISPTTSGHSSMDMMPSAQHGNMSGYAGHCPIICPLNSGNLISPRNVHQLPGFNSPPQMAGTPTGMRTLDQFEFSSPRIVLWDFQE